MNWNDYLETMVAQALAEVYNRLFSGLPVTRESDSNQLWFVRSWQCKELTHETR